MSRSTLRDCFKVVSCQLTRLRLLPTAQAMKAHDIRGRKTTVVSPVQSWKAQVPTLVKVYGSVREVLPSLSCYVLCCVHDGVNENFRNHVVADSFNT